MAAKEKSNEIRITRNYEAPIQAVWDAWTDPAQVAQWWGPRGFTLTTHRKDLRPGGTWVYTMHGPDGTDYPNRTYYFEVEKLSKLVYDHGASEDRPALFRVTVLFSQVPGGTKMEMTMTLPTPDAAEETRRFIKKAGGESTWDRLAEYLAKEISGKERFVINRSFDASRELMFDLWTDPDHFSKWLPPTGFEMEYMKAEIKPGGSTFYRMFNAKMEMFGRASYIEVQRPERLVYTQQFCDAKGNVSRHPLAPTWPETMLTNVEFTEEGPGRTRVTVTWEPYGTFTPEELQTFIKSRAGMTQGWTGSFDKLEAYLKAR